MIRRKIIISYDISDQSRLQKVRVIVKSLADMVQYSVYYAELLESDLIFLKSNLQEVIEKNEDQILFWDLGPAIDSAEDAFSVDSLGRKWVKNNYNILIF